MGCYGHDMYSQRSGSKWKKVYKHNMHVPRQLLRLRLLEALQPNTVRWGMSYEYHVDSDSGVNGNKEPVISHRVNFTRTILMRICSRLDLVTLISKKDYSEKVNNCIADDKIILFLLHLSQICLKN